MTTSNNFVPNRQIIENITNSNPGVVETTEDHGYLDGLYIRFVLQNDSGMTPLNNNVYLITVLSQNTFSIDADTRDYAPFSAGSGEQSPQVIPVAEVASTLKMAVKNNGNIIPET